MNNFLRLSAVVALLVACCMRLAAQVDEAVDNPGLVFTGSGSGGYWSVDTTQSHDGVDSARSGAIMNNQTSSMNVTVKGPANLVFWWKVSSEANFDFLRLFVDGVQVAAISGEQNWTQVTQALAAGTHTVEWRYTKDASLSNGDDAGWVDQLAIVPPNADDDLHIDGRIASVFISRTLITGVPAKNRFLANALVKLQRLDDAALPPAAADLPVRINWSLSDINLGPPGVVESGSHDFTVPLATHGGGVTPTPSSTVLQETFAVGVDELTQIFPTHLYTLTWSATYTDWNGAQVNIGSGQIDNFNLMKFSGIVHGGAITARFDEIGFSPNTVTMDGTGYMVTVDMPADHAWLADNSGAKFRLNNINVHYDPATLDISIVNGEPVSLADFSSGAQGVSMTTSGVRLKSTGLEADAVSVKLPAGFGIATTATSRVLSGEILFGNQSLDGSGVPLASPLTYSPGGSLYLVHEKLPVRYAAPSLTYDIGTGFFSTASATPTYVRKREREWLAQDLARNALTEPSAATKASNEAPYALADNAGPVSVSVRADPAGVALLTTSVPLVTNAPETFVMHFPKSTELTVSSGLVTVADSVFTGGQLTLDAPVSATYQRNPVVEPDCSFTFFNPDSTTIPVSISNNLLFLTIDGGWRADGTAAGGSTIQWGGLHGTRPTHELAGLTDVSLLVPGNVLSANASDPAITQRPAKLLLSGIGRPGEAAYVERAETDDYLKGLADYAGLNLRNAGNTLSARSFLGEQDTGNYHLKTLAKYYLRPSGITGVHDAVTAQIPSLHFYGYLTQLDGLRLAFLDSNNIASATGGSMTLPFPSDFSVDFEQLTFKPTGTLDKADLLANTPQKTLSYWGCTLKPDALDFTASKDCLTHASYLTLSGEIGLGYISNDKVRGTLAFAPDGKLIPPSANLAVDTSIPTPPRMAIQGRGDLSYPFVPATRLRFNNYDSNPGGPGDGFLFVAGSMDVPFFENLRVLLHLHPGKLDSACDVIGGWPSDPAQADRGWTTLAGENYFNSTKFDPNDNGYDTGVSLANFRNGYDKPGGVTNKFRPHVHKDWRKIVDFEFPMRWDPQTRQFLPAGDKSLKLLVLTAAGQVKKLDAAGAEMTFGAEFAALPKINIETFSRVLGDAGGYLTGSPEKKISTALTAALQGMVNQTLIQQGNKALDEVLADSITDLMRVPVEQAVVDILNTNSLFEGTLFQAMSDSYAANVVNGNGLATAKAALLAHKADFSGRMKTDLGAAVSAAMQNVESLGGRLEKADAALAQLEILCNPDQDSGTLIHALARRVAQQFLGQDFLGSADPGVGGPLNELVDGLLEDARPALRQIYQAIGKQRVQLNQIRNSLAANTGLGKQIRNAFTQNAVEGIANGAIEDLASEIGNSRDANGKFFDSSENSPAKLQARLRAYVIDRFHASPVGQSIKQALRQFVAPVRDVENQALNLAFAEVNHMVNEIALKIVSDLQGAIGNNPALISLRDTVSQSFDKAQDALGDFRKKYDSVASVFQFAKVQGYARTRGDTLDELRVDASIGISVPDPFGFQGFVLIKNLQSDVPSTSCRDPGIVATEVTVGSTFGGTLAQPVPASEGGEHQPDRKQAFRAQIEGRFSFREGAIGPDFPVPVPNGFDARVDFQTQIDLGLVSLNHLQLAIGLGGDEAYASAAASASIWFIPAQGRVFLGSTRQLSILREAFDDQTYKLVVTQGSSPSADGHCLPHPVVGIYSRFAGQVSLNRVFGIPDNPCLISLNAGRKFGHFALFSTNGAGLQLNVGYLEAYTITGTALCVVGVDAEAGFLVALDILPNSLTTSLSEAFNSVKGTGVAHVDACVSVIGVKKCFHGSFTVDVRPNPLFAPPILVTPVGFEY